MRECWRHWLTTSKALQPETALKIVVQSLCDVFHT
jgi:hypothetical protein